MWLLLRFCGERLDVWVLRFAEHAPMKFHGLKEVAHCTTAEVINATKAVWFLDGVDKRRQEAVAAILQELPALAQKEIAGIDQRRIAARFAKEVGAGNPSSGWQGLSHCSCIRQHFVAEVFDAKKGICCTSGVW